MDPWQDPHHVRMEEGQVVVVVVAVEVAVVAAAVVVEEAVAQADRLVASFDEALNQKIGIPS